MAPIDKRAKEILWQSFDSFSYDQYQLILSYMYTTETNQIIFLIWVNVIQNNIKFLSCFYNYFKTDKPKLPDEKTYFWCLSFLWDISTQLLYWSSEALKIAVSYHIHHFACRVCRKSSFKKGKNKEREKTCEDVIYSWTVHFLQTEKINKLF